jgi:hypothetical protein
MKKFLSLKYNQDQIVEALNCPINRHCTRVEHCCDDWELHLHPEWLLEHFISHGGAVEFAKRREDKRYWMEVIDDDKTSSLSEKVQV